MALTDGTDPAGTPPWPTGNESTAETFGPSFIDTDGSITGRLGTAYQNGSRGTIRILLSPFQDRTSVTVNPADTTGAWSIQYDANGNGFKINKITGEVIPLDFDKTPSGVTNPADRNGDGLDDTTNMALGVYADKNSPSGFSYGRGTPVWPNGAPLTASEIAAADNGPAGNIQTWSSGGNVYRLGPDGKPVIFIQGSSSSGGSLNSSSSRPLSAGEQATLDKVRTANNIMQQQAAADSQAALERERVKAQMERDKYLAELSAQAAADARAFSASESAAERAQRAAQFEQTYGLSVQQFEAQRAEKAAELRLRNIKDFESAVSDTDMAKLAARKLALGVNGDVQIADLLRNTPGGFQANDVAAALLAEIRGEGGTGQATGIAGQFGIPAAAAPAAPMGSIGGGTPAVGAPTPGIPAAEMASIATTPAASVVPETRDEYIKRKYGDIVAQRAASEAKSNDRAMRSLMREANREMSGWEPVPEMTADQIRAANYQFGMNQNIERGAQHSLYPGFGNYVAPSTAWQTGGDRPTPVYDRQIDTDFKNALPPGSPGDTAALATGATLIDGVWVPNKAYGTETPYAGPSIVGDPQRAGVPNPEMVQWTPQGNIVKPLNQMGPIQASIPKFAWGTDALGQATWTNDGEIAASDSYGTSVGTSYNPRTRTRTTAYTPIATAPAPTPVVQPVAPMQPVSQIGYHALGEVAPVAPYAAAPVPVPAPVTGAGTPVEVSPRANPMNPVASTPGSQAYLDEIRKFRDEQTSLGGLNPMDVSWGRASPLLRQAYYEQMKTRFGIPIEDQIYEQQRYAMQGIGRGARPLGY